MDLQASANGTIKSATPGRSPESVNALPFTKFVWGAGIECSFIPHLNVDQFDWTQHNTFWREDLAKAKELGVTHMRYALPAIRN